MNYEAIDAQYITCNTIDANMIFVEDDSDMILEEHSEVVLEDQAEVIFEDQAEVILEEEAEVILEDQTEITQIETEKSSNLSKDEDIEIWVNEKANKDCIRFFKPQFCMSPKYPQLGLDVYFLLIVTKPQVEFLKKFHERLVCVDRQTGENFEVVSLFVLDDREECLPCAFLFTNKVDLEVLKAFFSEIKSLVGKVETKLILSEKFNDVGKIWDEIMESSVKNMICSWDVIKDWTFNLWSVETKGKVHATYKELEQLLQEKDINTFTTKCETLVNNLLSDPESEEFGLYFSENYAKHPHTWACCYRYEEEDSRGYNQLEKMHSIIHYILQTKTTKKLIKALDVTLDFLRNKIYDRLILLNNGKVSSKLAEIRHRHKVAEKMIYEIANRGTFWTVTSRKKEQHVVTLCKGSCNCQTMCLICNVCSHTYICSCIDSVLKLNMCRHIHSVCISEAAGTTIDCEEDVGDRIGSNTLIPSQMLIKPLSTLNRTVSEPLKDIKKTPRVSQIKKRKSDTNTQFIFYTKYTPNSSKNNKVSSERVMTNKRLKMVGEGVSENVQNVQSDCLEMLDQKVSIADEEMYDESQTLFMDNNVEIKSENHNFGIGGACLKVKKEGDNTSETNRSASLERRRTNIEKIFKTILNCVQNEEQMVKVESAVSKLRNDVECSSSSSLHKNIVIDSKNFNQSAFQVPKILSTNGQPVILGKTVILKMLK